MSENLVSEQFDEFGFSEGRNPLLSHVFEIGVDVFYYGV